MGSSNTKEQQNDGMINNNITIEDTVKVHNDEIVLMLKIVVTIMILNVLSQIVRYFAKSLKRKYTGAPGAGILNAQNAQALTV